MAENPILMLLTLAIHFDTRTFVVTGKGNTLIRYFARVMELAEQNIMRNLGVIGNDTLEGNATDHLNLIVNVQGYNLRQHACLRCFPIYLAWTEIYEHFYPAYVKHLFIINAPRIVAPLVEFLKPLMSPQTRNAFKVYGHKTEWQPAIIGKIIPTNQVRAAFGGTKAN